MVRKNRYVFEKRIRQSSVCLLFGSCILGQTALCDATIRYSQIAENNYNQELTKLQSQFYQYLESLNGRSDILMKSLQRMNTAQNHEQLKSGFLALADKSRNLFEDGDWEDFINGTKTIEL